MGWGRLCTYQWNHLCFLPRCCKQGSHCGRVECEPKGQGGGEGLPGHLWADVRAELTRARPPCLRSVLPPPVIPLIPSVLPLPVLPPLFFLPLLVFPPSSSLLSLLLCLMPPFLLSPFPISPLVLFICPSFPLPPSFPLCLFPYPPYPSHPKNK